jgi:hypothetical protein
MRTSIDDAIEACPTDAGPQDGVVSSTIETQTAA